MKAYLWSVDGNPPPTRSRWRRFVDRYLPSLVIYLMVVTLIGVVLFPYVAITVPSGHVGVLWKRFGGGTVLDPRQLKDEGLHLVWPWNEVFLYDLRLQSITDTYNAISSDGVSLNATLIIRFRLQRDAVPVIHQSIGRDNLQTAGEARNRQPDARGHGAVYRRAGLFDGAPGNSGQDSQPRRGQVGREDDGARRW
jgi:hypothetical protein